MRFDPEFEPGRASLVPEFPVKSDQASLAREFLVKSDQAQFATVRSASANSAYLDLKG